jgi:hypothetical protein
MAEKYVVVTKKGKTGELSKETAQRVAAEIGGGAQVVPAEVAKTLESKPVGKSQGSPAGIFLVASIIIGVIVMAMFKEPSVAIASAIGAFFTMIVSELWITRK